MYSPREAAKDHLYTHSFASLLLLLPLGLLMLMAKGDGIPHLKTSLAQANAQGVIEQVMAHPTIPYTQRVNYRFTTADGSTVQSSYTQNQLTDKTPYTTGQHVPIVYSRWSGADSIAAVYERSTTGFYMFVTCLSLMVGCVLYSAWNMKKLFKHTDEERFY